MNIFAQELERILNKHGFRIGSLYHVANRAINSRKVTRIKQELYAKANSSTLLNVTEMDIIKKAVPLTDNEMNRLKAALMAESLRHLTYERLTRLAEIHMAKSVKASNNIPETAQKEIFNKAYIIGQSLFSMLLNTQESNTHTILKYFDQDFAPSTVKLLEPESTGT